MRHILNTNDLTEEEVHQILYKKWNKKIFAR